MSILTNLKAFAQVLLNTESEIPGSGVAEVLDYLAENYTPPTGDGADGDDGADGATWSSGTAAPSGGSDGDFYLKTDTMDVYKKAAGSWSIICNIKGAAGTGIASATPVNAINAAGVITMNGVGKHGDKFTIGGKVYELRADAAQALSEGSDYAVNIEAHTVKATDNLTIAVNPTAGDTIVIGTKTYTFVSPASSALSEGEIGIGADAAATQAAVKAAINGTDDHNTANDKAVCGDFAVNVAPITAISGGTAGNDIATTSSFANGGNLFSAVKLATGADATAANTVLDIVASVTANDANVSAADGQDDTVTLTAKIAGASGNAITLSEDLTNGTVDHDHLQSGADATTGAQWDMKVDASYLYVCIAANLVSGKNWRRVSLGSAY